MSEEHVCYNCRIVFQNPEAVKAKETETKSQEEAARAEQKKAQCESAQAYLKNLRAGNRIVKFDPKTGERYFPDEAQYAKEIAAAEATVAANCK